jgi:hypothetical protein
MAGRRLTEGSSRGESHICRRNHLGHGHVIAHPRAARVPVLLPGTVTEGVHSGHAEGQQDEQQQLRQAEMPCRTANQRRPVHLIPR